MVATTACALVNLGVVPRHQVRLVTQEVSSGWETWELLHKKKWAEPHIFAPLTAALHQLYTLKDCLKIQHSHCSSLYTTQRIGRWPGCSDAGFGPVLWRLTSALICSLTRECVCIVLFPRPVLLFVSLILGEYNGYIDYTFFIDFTSWASNVCFSVNGCREERGTRGDFEWLWIWIIIIYNLLPLSLTH